jgi:hypothetical protein
MSERCSCGCESTNGCTGIRRLTPLPAFNRTGLSALTYRVGTHASFLETMKAALSGAFAVTDDVAESPLRRLRTRDPSDPAIALLDAWATVADVLTFYCERIANEGYLRTATERRSLVELARLVGYQPRPGVAASTLLAYTLEAKADPTLLAAGNRATSVPGPGETAQSFETSEDLAVRPEWNTLPPRMRHPQVLNKDTPLVYFKGNALNLRVGDLLLFQPLGKDGAWTRRVLDVQLLPNPDPELNRTVARIAFPKQQQELALSTAAPPTPNRRSEVLKKLISAEWPGNSESGRLATAAAFASTTDTSFSMLGALHPELAEKIYHAVAEDEAPNDQAVVVSVMRVSAREFGHNAPRLSRDDEGNFDPDGTVRDPKISEAELFATAVGGGPGERWLSLDGEYAAITPESAVIGLVPPKHAADQPIVAKVIETRTVTRADYGLSASVTQLRLSDEKLSEAILKASQENADQAFQVIRRTRIYAAPELLPLADEPMEDPISGSLIELADLYSSLDGGRLLIVKGERSDLPGVIEAEAVRLTGVEQFNGWLDNNSRKKKPWDKLHSLISVGPPLRNSYKRSTVKIYGNVTAATQGETRNETLGSGNPRQPWQTFTLQQYPLTFVPSTEARGAVSTLHVRVNDVLWHEAEALLDLADGERGYVTRIDDDDRVHVTFGGRGHGSQPPSGTENIRATLRVGIGEAGNVKAGQISQLASRPLGVKEVVNPMPAGGGADRDGPEAIRTRAPLGTVALDRLVSVQDYADFSRMYAGIGKADARLLTSGRRRVQVTVAGENDITLTKDGETLRHLRRTLRELGDPHFDVRVAARELKLLVIRMHILVIGDYRFADVEPRVRAAVLDAFSFERRSLGEAALASVALAAAQRAEGVEFADLDVFKTISEEDIKKSFEDDKAPDLGGGVQPRIDVLPKQLAFLSPKLPMTLTIEEVKS